MVSWAGSAMVTGDGHDRLSASRPGTGSHPQIHQRVLRPKGPTIVHQRRGVQGVGGIHGENDRSYAAPDLDDHASIDEHAAEQSGQLYRELRGVSGPDLNAVIE
jgi:hypothetical protein